MQSQGSSGGSLWSIAATVGCWTMACVVLAVYGLAYLAGQLHLLLFVMLPLTVACVGVSRGVAALRRKLTTRLLRNPFARESRWHWLQWSNRLLCYGLVVLAIHLAVPRFLLTSEEFLASVVLFAWGPAVVLTLLELVPPQRIRLSVNLMFLVAWLFLSVNVARLFVVPPFSEQVTLTAPFAGEWVVFQGGRSVLLNHHYPIQAQRHALDLIVHGGPPRNADSAPLLTSFPTFGQPMYAPSDGIVVRAVNDQPDQAIGESDRHLLVGNHVVIERDDGKFVLLAHLMQGSILPSVGDRVRSGELIARCGNSGNTSEPHLHLQVQNRADWTAGDLCTYPIRFRDITHRRWGTTSGEQAGELMRNDVLVAPVR